MFRHMWKYVLFLEHQCVHYSSEQNVFTMFSSVFMDIVRYTEYVFKGVLRVCLYHICIDVGRETNARIYDLHFTKYMYHKNEKKTQHMSVIKLYKLVFDLFCRHSDLFLWHYFATHGVAKILVSHIVYPGTPLSRYFTTWHSPIQVTPLSKYSPI